MTRLAEILRDEWRFLTFQPMGGGVRERPWDYLAFGLACAWIAGIGRYWDNPRASWWQHLGLGSVAYVFVLALVVWVLVAPLRPKNWSYSNVLLFVTLTSPPAILYAIPVEQALTLDTARAVNAWFLAAVATWRVALLVVFLSRVAGLSAIVVAIAALLPLVAIVISLALLNLEHVVFNLMSGTSPEERTGNDAAYLVVSILAVASFVAAPVVLVAYLIAIFLVRRVR